MESDHLGAKNQRANGTNTQEATEVGVTQLKAAKITDGYVTQQKSKEKQRYQEDH